MGWFPFFIQLEGARGLLVGGGRVALRKAEKLLPFGAQLTVVAPCICPPLAALPGLTLCRRAFADSDLSPAPDFVIAATGDRALDRRIAALCRARRILVNVVDDPAACGFYFPALVQRGRLCIGISTGGASPTAAAWLRQKIEALLPPGFDGILDRLASRREAVKAEGGSEAKRAERLQQAFALELAAAEAPRAPAAAWENAGPGRVALVGAGCGRADLITVRGLWLLQQCRAVVYDDLIDSALLDTAPAGAERIYVGKRSGRHSAPHGGEMQAQQPAGQRFHISHTRPAAFGFRLRRQQRHGNRLPGLRGAAFGGIDGRKEMPGQHVVRLAPSRGRQRRQGRFRFQRVAVGFVHYVFQAIEGVDIGQLDAQRLFAGVAHHQQHKAVAV